MKTTTIALFLIIGLSACNETAKINTENSNVKINEDNLSSLQILIEGNKRFFTEQSVHPNETLNHIKLLKNGQHPSTVIVSCSDSRVSPELIFDQGLGDIFSIRTAGNVIGEYELASIEYAVEHLKCELIVVLGHENCGALDAFAHRAETEHHNHINSLIEYMSNEPEIQSLPDSLKTNVATLVNINVIHATNFLKNSDPVLKHLVDKKELKIIGALYDLDNGKVTIIEKNNVLL